MSAAIDIITEALREITVHSVVSPAQPDDIITTMNRLNSMLEMWLSEGILLNTRPIEVPADELAEPADCRNGIIFNLAIAASSNFSGADGSLVSDDLRRNAGIQMGMIRGVYQAIVPFPRTLSRTTPRGAGNTRGTLPRTFAGPGRRIGG